MGKRTINVTLEDLNRNVVYDLGFAGENEHTEIVIDSSEVYDDYSGATVEAVFRNANGEAYPHTASASSGNVTLTLNDTDTAIPGTLLIQLEFTSGTEIIKSVILTGHIEESLQTDGSSPSPAQRFAGEMADVLADQIAAAAETVTPVIVVNCGTISSLPVTLSAVGVTEDYTLIGYEIGTPTIMTSKLTVETGDGIVTLSGTKNTGSTTMKLKLIKATRVVDAEEVPD